jgi:hypothetical protein
MEEDDGREEDGREEIGRRIEGGMGDEDGRGG